jgi:hypothetical protein
MTNCLFYQPNATADGKDATVGQDQTAGLRLDQRAVAGGFVIEWFCPHAGVAAVGGTVQGGDLREPTPLGQAPTS